MAARNRGIERSKPPLDIAIGSAFFATFVVHHWRSLRPRILDFAAATVESKHPITGNLHAFHCRATHAIRDRA